VSFFGGNSRDDWTGWDANLRYALDRKTGVALGIERAERFGLTDEQWSLSVDRRISDDWSAYGRISATPDADFFANHMLALGGAWRVRDGDTRLPPTLLLLDYRAAEYDPGTAHLLAIGVTQYTAHRFSITAKYTRTRNLNDRWTDGWQVRVDGEPADHWRWYAGYADGNESLSSTVFDFIRNQRTQALFAGAYREFSSALGMRIDLTHEWSKGLPDRNAIHVGFTTRF
jgi:YaiO family outer membrane protein